MGTLMPESTTASPAQVWISLSLVYVIWGSTYLGIAVTVETMPPLQALGVRFLSAALLLGTFLVVRRGPGVIRVSRREVASSALLGFLMLVCAMGMLAYAEQHVATGVAALIVAIVPLWVVILRAISGDRPRLLTWLGVAVGLVGLAVLLLPRSSAGQGEGDSRLWWSLGIMAGSSCWAIGSFLQPRLQTPRDPLVLTFFEMLAGGVFMIVIGTVIGERWDISAISARSIWALAYLITFGSLVGFVAYVWLIDNAPLSLVSTYAYVNPVVAVILGIALHGEKVSSALLLGGAIVVVGVGMVVTAERRTRNDLRDLPEIAT
ncbi:MAG: EamA family transporter [Candidatus Nanopelagicales bacterium]